MRRDSRNIMIGAVGSLVATLVVYLATKAPVYAAAGAAVLTLGASVAIARRLMARWRRRAIFDHFMTLVDEDGDGTPRHMFYIDQTARPFLRNRLQDHGSAAPAVFMQIRLKEFTSWVDASYLVLMRQLAGIGFRAHVLIHDYGYLRASDDESRMMPLDREEYAHDLRQFERHVCKIAGRKVRVVPASRFFAQDEHAATFVNSFYGGFLPVVAERASLTGSGAPTLEFLRFLLGLFAVNILGQKSVCLSVVWEERKPWVSEWRTVYNRNNVAFVYGRTARGEGQRPIGVDARAESLCLDDDVATMRAKSEALDQELLETVWMSIVEGLLSPGECLRLRGGADHAVTCTSLVDALAVIKQRLGL